MSKKNGTPPQEGTFPDPEGKEDEDQQALKEGEEDQGQGEGQEGLDHEKDPEMESKDGKEGEEGQGEGGVKPPAPNQGDSRVTVLSPNRAGKTIVAVSGDPITFDGEGKALVLPGDADYLKACPGFVVG
jgi:hypothetical protein